MRADRVAKINRDGSAGPGGAVRIDPDNQHAWKAMRLGKIVEGPGSEKGETGSIQAARSLVWWIVPLRFVRTPKVAVYKGSGSTR